MSDSTDVDDELPEDVRNLQPAARHVYRELVFAGEPITITELQHRSGLALPTIRQAITDLEDTGKAISQWDTDDARRRLVKIPQNQQGNS